MTRGLKVNSIQALSEHASTRNCSATFRSVSRCHFWRAQMAGGVLRVLMR